MGFISPHTNLMSKLIRHVKEVLASMDKNPTRVRIEVTLYF